MEIDKKQGDTNIGVVQMPFYRHPFTLGCISLATLAVACLNLPVEALYNVGPRSIGFGWPEYCGRITTDGPVESITFKDVQLQYVAKDGVVAALVIACAAVASAYHIRTRRVRFTMRTACATIGLIATVSGLESLGELDSADDRARRIVSAISILVVYSILAFAWYSIVGIFATGVSRRGNC